MKGQDKTPEKQLNEDRIPSRKRIHSDSEDDSGSQKKNGEKDWEDARNVYQRPRRTKEQTEMDITLLLLLSHSVVSDSVRPHRQQPMRLPHPWGSPGKNTGVGCHFLLQCMKVKRESEVAQSCPTLSDPMDCSPPGSAVPGILQAKTLEWGAIACARQWYKTDGPCAPPELTTQGAGTNLNQVTVQMPSG